MRDRAFILLLRRLSVVHPQLYVTCLEVVRELARHPDTVQGLMRLLRSDNYNLLMDILPEEGNEEMMMSEEYMGYWVVVKSRACLLDILSQVLLVLEPAAKDDDREVCMEMFRRLLGLREDSGTNVRTFGVHFLIELNQETDHVSCNFWKRLNFLIIAIVAVVWFQVQ